MNKIKKVLLGMLLLVCLSTVAVVPAVAATETTASTQTTQKKYKRGWFKKGGKYYWRNYNGTVRTKRGLFDTGDGIYFLDKGGVRVSSAYRKANGKYYYFQEDGKMLKPRKKGFRTIAGKKSYIYANGVLASGRKKIGNTYYYFNHRGVLQKNLRAIQVGKYYYHVNSKGVMTRITKTQALCSQAAQRFIKQHSSSSQTNEQKFRSCFYYLLGYMRYSPGYFSTSGDYQILGRADGAYEMALSTFNSPNLRGNCHRFAACVAAMAKELGYSNPTMVVTTGDHSFVMINGGYYDNMYGGLFGASSRPGYSVYKNIVFK